ncbi:MULTISPECIES: hypothetical protein [Streptomyces]|uniref:Uncharacterized protein n=1 Tax=Streptomyces dengpaensis TaxID=2049881 RepID=A0ABN5HY31_9ACTN|nr:MULTISPECIES: hypothetical protein [Streptomyces]AVH55859.1 hypothetical protein C4B68_08835 [Streptomyces dengpaensis]PIB12110.1 hypothetical protein B1C81_02770 [Streptomyces sp. HG99]
MNADTITAASATVIALGSLWVSYTQTRSSRLHNRQSVRPLLVMRRIKGWGEAKIGLQVINAGLGPAIVTHTVVRLDGQDIGQWDRHGHHRVTESLPVWPMVYSLRPGAVVLAGQSTFLLHFDEEFRESEHREFWDLITRRLVIEIHYESLYGGENFKASPPQY